MSEKLLTISFCGDCFHCKDNPQVHHKDEKSFCEREGKYFNHNDALFPDWCRLPDKGGENSVAGIVEEINYALVGGNLDKEDIPCEVVGQNLTRILAELRK